MFEILQYDYAERALLASVMVGVTCGVLGCFVILKRMALIGDALSHAILPGVVGGFILFGHHPLAMFIGAVMSGLLTSTIITWVQRNSITKDDSSIGIVFTAMFALGIIGISWITKREGVHLDMKDFLFGNVLGVTKADLVLTYLIGFFVILCIVSFFKYFFVSTFDPTIAATLGVSVALIHYFTMFLLSITIVASLQSVGVILVVAMLIIPGSTAYLLTNKLKTMLFLSALVGALSATLGLWLAIVTELTPGPLMALVGTLLFTLALLFSPQKGYLVKIYNSYQKRESILQEDILKYIQNKDEQGVVADMPGLKLALNLGDFRLKMLVRQLNNKKYITFGGQELKLTDEGQVIAMQLVRAHRLWETYLSEKLGVPMDKVHSSAEDMEHISKKEFWDEVNKELGFPTTDPHGSPIPDNN
jgi:ABC-type Mn2+/Zn2+ transport system permease subunit/Mn-dependent DtxR family transcriptional regulator